MEHFLLSQQPEHYDAYLSSFDIFSLSFGVTLIQNHFLDYTRENAFLNIFFKGIKLSGLNDTQRDLNNDILFHGRNRIVYTYVVSQLANASKATVNLTIYNVTREDIGLYEIIFTVPRDKVDLRCCLNHKNFIRSSNGMNLENYIAGMATVELKKAGG